MAFVLTPINMKNPTVADIRKALEIFEDDDVVFCDNKTDFLIQVISTKEVMPR